MSKFLTCIYFCFIYNFISGNCVFKQILRNMRTAFMDRLLCFRSSHILGYFKPNLRKCWPLFHQTFLLLHSLSLGLFCAAPWVPVGQFLFSFFFILFSLFFRLDSFYWSVFTLTNLSLVFHNLPLHPSSNFLISDTILFSSRVYTCLFLIVSLSQWRFPICSCTKNIVFFMFLSILTVV